MREASFIDVGEFTVTAISDGVLNSNHDVILGIDKAEIARLTGVPYGEPLPLDVNCFLIRHRDRLILSDAGSGHTMGPTLGKLPQNLRAIGIAPEAIDLVMLTHLHPDHSLGLIDETGRAVFPNAELIVHSIEAAFWLDRAAQPTDSERITRNTKAQHTAMAPYRDRIRQIEDGEVLQGITATLRPGHTPGHTNWLLESGGERMLIWGDIVHLASVQMARPDATLVFDVEPTLAQASRERVFEFAAAECLLVAGAHLPFPGVGRVERAGKGFRFRAEK
jgi:glyoxylase-like metal-dependent hydrolase (beta-lactamase superfamily II)